MEKLFQNTWNIYDVRCTISIMKTDIQFSARNTFLICCGMGDMRKAHYGSCVSICIHSEVTIAAVDYPV
jgi:hypothetical protein